MVVGLNYNKKAVPVRYQCVAGLCFPALHFTAQIHHLWCIWAVKCANLEWCSARMLDGEVQEC